MPTRWATWLARGGAAFAAALVGSFEARAERIAPVPPALYRLEVSARPGADRCPTTERLVPAIVARVGHDPFDAAAPARLAVTFERSARGYDARIERFASDGAPAGKKSLSGPSCEALADALALSIAIAVDAPLPRTTAPAAASSASSASAAAPVPIAPAVLPEGWGDAPAPAPPAAPPASSGPKVFAQLGIGGTVAGATPSPAALAALGLGAGFGEGRYLLGVDVLGTLPTHARAEGAEVSVALLGARPQACRSVVGGGRLSACAQGFLGVLQGAAEGAGGKRDSTFFASVGGGLQAALPLSGGLLVVPSLSASFTLTRTSLYANDRPVFTTRPLGLDGGLALRLLL